MFQTNGIVLTIYFQVYKYLTHFVIFNRSQVYQFYGLDITSFTTAFPSFLTLIINLSSPPSLFYTSNTAELQNFQAKLAWNHTENVRTATTSLSNELKFWDITFLYAVIRDKIYNTHNNKFLIEKNVFKKNINRKRKRTTPQHFCVDEDCMLLEGGVLYGFTGKISRPNWQWSKYSWLVSQFITSCSASLSRY